ncbi:APC family permease [Microbispora sp. ATCC PTA-5024]|uniref:APC family permease n=1 Tax=Microbispora sp. ATCC PTA-5024 TaxID=316330 RepID=UPI0003DDAF4F|nr:APC family permease [Microbispora sp. ATCC PTA-5024]ETK30530.1 porin [Microbispora sp. ATCC PTA-5024]
MSSPSEASPPAGDAGVERFGYKQELQRSLSYVDLLIYGLIFMVPIAPFGIFGSVFQASGGMVALAYVIGMAAMAFTALSYAQMARAFPMAGSVYTYAGRGIAAPVGFLAGWVILLDYVLVPALLYLVASAAMTSFVPAVPIWVWLIGFIVLNTVVNYLGIEMTARMNKIMLIAEMIVLAIFLVVGLVALAQGKGHGGALSPLFDSSTFSWPLVFGAVSVAVLSFLGFDGISMLAEESRENTRRLGRSMVMALALAGALFVVQTWVAALLAPGRDELLAKGDPAGTAFYDTAEYAGGHWLSVLTAVATAVAWGFANSLVAQAATSRLLFAMARDRQLPSFLRKVHPRHKVPVNATFVVAAVSLVLGLYMASRDDGIPLLSSLVNFGAMTAFLALHVSVVVHYVVRNGSRDWWRHLAAPAIGFLILLYVVINAKVAAQVLGFVWLAIGAIILAGSYLMGRRPTLSAMTTEVAE